MIADGGARPAIPSEHLRRPTGYAINSTNLAETTNLDRPQGEGGAFIRHSGVHLNYDNQSDTILVSLGAVSFYLTAYLNEHRVYIDSEDITMITLNQIETGLDKLRSIVNYLSSADMDDSARDEALSMLDQLHDELCCMIDETI